MYKCGDKFLNKNGFGGNVYVIARAPESYNNGREWKVFLTSLSDGEMWSTPVGVADFRSITEEEFRRISDNTKFELYRRPKSVQDW